MSRTSDLVGFQISSLKLFSVWRRKDAGFFYHLKFIVTVFLAGSITTLMLVGSFTETDTAFSPLLTSNAIMKILKVFNVYIKTYKVEAFLKRIDELPFFSEPGEKATKESRVRRLKLLPRILSIMFTVLAGLILIKPLVFGKFTQERVVPVWYPFEWRGQLDRSILLYLYENTSLLILTVFTLFAETFHTCLLLIVSGQFESLGYRLRNLPVDCSRSWKKEFQKCVDDYNILYKLSKGYEDIFSGVILIHTAFSCMAICLSAYGMRLATDADTFVKSFLYIVTMLYEIFLTCYAGDDVAERSEQLLINLYSSSWTDLPSECRRLLLMFSLRLNRPIVIQFGFIQYLRLRTFTQIVDAAYKLYALLQRLPK